MKIKINLNLKLNEKLKLNKKFNKKITIIILLIIIVIVALAMTIFSGSATSFSGFREKPDAIVSSFFDAAKAFDFEKMESYVNPDNVGILNNLADKYTNTNNVIDKYFSVSLPEAAAKLTYEIKATTITDDTASVTVSCKYIDGSKFILDVIQEYIDIALETTLAGSEITPQQANSMLSKIAAEKKSSIIPKDIPKDKPKNKTKDAPQETPKEEPIEEPKDVYIDKTFDVKCVKIGGKWKIDTVNGEMIRAITANISSNANKKMLTKIDNFITTEFWYLGFREIDSYIKQGTDSNGKTLNIDLTLKQLEQAIIKKSEYDKYISNLDDTNYASVKNSWTKLSTEIDVLYNNLKTDKPVANNTKSTFSINKFKQSQWDFSAAVSGVQ